MNVKSFGVTRALATNTKTRWSVDVTKNCRGPHGTPCVYCYTWDKRNRNMLRQVALVDKLYYGNEILFLDEQEIGILNRSGGLRLCGNADVHGTPKTHPWAYAIMRRVKEDADARGLKLKALTKSIPFAEWALKRNIRVNLSLDNFGTGVMPSDWQRLLNKYPELVRLRCMVENPSKIDDWGNRLKDYPFIMTLYHGCNYPELGLQTMPWRMNVMKEAKKSFPLNLCCQTGKCETCPVKCGYLE